MDPNRDRNSFAIRLCGSGSKKEHGTHDRGGMEPTTRRSVRRWKRILQRRSEETSRKQKHKIFFDKVRQKGSRR